MFPQQVVSILLADAHVMLRDGLKRLMDTESDLRVVGEAGEAPEVLRLARLLQPDVMLLDLGIRGGGLNILKALLTGPPTRTRSILLTEGASTTDLVEALQLGARGIVLKEAAAALLFRSIRCVIRGTYWVEETDIADVVTALQLLIPSDSAERKAKPYGLTPREMEIVSHVAGGAANKDIAQNFSVREDTVKHHLSSIFDKLGVYSRLELALFAMHHGLVEWSPGSTHNPRGYPSPKRPSPPIVVLAGEESPPPE